MRRSPVMVVFCIRETLTVLMLSEKMENQVEIKGVQREDEWQNKLHNREGTR